MPVDLTTLNENQRKAVLWEEGPLLVLAGPGSGKTRVLAFRIVRLLEERDDVSVVALTFTSKAAAEMRERVDQLLGQRGDRVRLCTFHTFAADILRQHGSHLGLRPDFNLLTHDEDRIAVLDVVAAELESTGYAVPPDRRGLLGLLDRLFAMSYDGGAEPPFRVQLPDWLPPLFRAYCDALVGANRLDFGSLLSLAYRLLREKPGVARVLRLGWTHVCVDEFQDTNKAQYDLLKLIVADEQPNLFVVGDDDQILYQWNGASPERLQALRSDYNMEVVQLPENYRCPAEIIGRANRLIVHNRMRAPDKQPLVSLRDRDTDGLEDGATRYFVFDTLEDEVAAIAKDIEVRGIAPADCAVLARTGKLLTSAATALRSAGHVAYVVRRKTEFDSPVVRVMFCALRLANARHDRDALRRLCVAWKALTDQTLEVEDVAASATLVGGDFLRAWAESAVADVVEGEAAFLVKNVRDSLVDRLRFPGIVEWFLEEGWRRWGDDADLDLTEEMASWSDLHGNIVREYGHEDLTLNVYLQQIDLAPKIARPSSNAIPCLTVHGSKGLEFKHVYLIGMAQEVLPSFQALRRGPDSHEIEEERRNCFVAITRVQETLTLSRARTYNGWTKEPSQFLAELGLERGE